MLAISSPAKSQGHVGGEAVDNISKSRSLSSLEEKFMQLPDGQTEQEVVVVVVVVVSWLFDRFDDLPVKSECMVVLGVVVACVVVVQQSSGGPGP